MSHTRDDKIGNAPLLLKISATGGRRPYRATGSGHETDHREFSDKKPAQVVHGLRV